jgi:hypothetical protein
MNPQDKYEECLAIIAAIHDLCHIMVESGEGEGMSSFQIVEEALATLASAEAKIGDKTVSVNNKDKKTIH